MGEQPHPCFLQLDTVLLRPCAERLASSRVSLFFPVIARSLPVRRGEALDLPYGLFDVFIAR